MMMMMMIFDKYGRAVAKPTDAMGVNEDAEKELGTTEELEPGGKFWVGVATNPALERRVSICLGENTIVQFRLQPAEFEATHALGCCDIIGCVKKLRHIVLGALVALGV